MSITNSGIYKLTLKLDGRIYIGGTSNIKKRLSFYRNTPKRSTLQIAKAIKKHGFDSFVWEILEYTANDEKIIEKREQYYLDILKPFVKTGVGFNIREKAEINLGVIPSKETRQKMSNAHKGKILTEETKKRMSDGWHACRGENYYNKLRERMTGRTLSTETKKKISESKMGSTWKHDTERVKKHINRMKKESIFNDPQFKKRMKGYNIGAKRSDKAKLNMSKWQQRLYKITDPTGKIYSIYSKDLKTFCKDNKLGYPNLQQCSKNGKTYKKWSCEVISADKQH